MSSEIREPTWLVLTALAGGRLHGYGIIRQVESLSDGRLRLRAGTLYATLDRLHGDGLVAVDGEEVVNGRLRRYYVLTALGSVTLAAEARQRVTVATEALRRIEIAGGFA